MTESNRMKEGEPMGNIKCATCHEALRDYQIIIWDQFFSLHHRDCFKLPIGLILRVNTYQHIKATYPVLNDQLIH